jgi:hypothetical protein
VRYTVHFVLAGAYRGKRRDLKTTLTHASLDDGDTAVCGQVQAGNLCDIVGTELTCPACRRKGSA